MRKKAKPKRKYGKLTQAMILQRIKEGTLLVCFETMSVYTGLRPKKGGRVKSELRSMSMKHRGGRRKEYPCVKIAYNNCLIQIALHRLAWIAYNLREIPEGCEIDHYPDKNPENWHYSNLVLRTVAEHKLRHANEGEDLPT